jgi:hypothetical protein
MPSPPGWICRRSRLHEDRAVGAASPILNDPAAIRLIGSLMIEQNDDWMVACRYLSVEPMAQLLDARQFEENSSNNNTRRPSSSTPPEKRNAPNDEHAALHHLKRLDSQRVLAGG